MNIVRIIAVAAIAAAVCACGGNKDLQVNTRISDNFNAGIVFGLISENVMREDIPTLDEKKWDRIIKCGLDFSAEVCKSINNSISREFAHDYLLGGEPLEMKLCN